MKHGCSLAKSDSLLVFLLGIEQLLNFRWPKRFRDHFESRMLPGLTISVCVPNLKVAGAYVPNISEEKMIITGRKKSGDLHRLRRCIGVARISYGQFGAVWCDVSLLYYTCIRHYNVTRFCQTAECSSLTALSEIILDKCVLCPLEIVFRCSSIGVSHIAHNLNDSVTSDSSYGHSGKNSILSVWCSMSSIWYGIVVVSNRIVVAENCNNYEFFILLVDSGLRYHLRRRASFNRCNTVHLK